MPSLEDVAIIHRVRVGMTSGHTRHLAALTLTVVLMASLGPGFIASFKPEPQEGVDFFQDWSSARNWREGLPIYAELRLTAERYLGRTFADDQDLAVPRNAHPPTSVLMSLPFGYLSYPSATAAWNVLSLAAFALALVLIGRQLGAAVSPLWILPAAALFLTCNPFRHQVEMGQINGVLLAFLVGVWAAERNDRPGLAGALLGFAVAIRLTPALLFAFYLLRRRWAVVLWGMISVLAISAVTVGVIGITSYLDYTTDVLPLSPRYTPMRLNASLSGLWTKWFSAGTMSQVTVEQVIPPVIQSHLLSRAGFLVSALGVLYVLARIAARVRSPEDIDAATGVWLTGMLLLSPTTWDHNFLVLAMPLWVLWGKVAAQRRQRLVFMALVAILWANPTPLWLAIQPLRGVNPFVPRLVVSLQAFALIGVFWLAVATFNQPSAFRRHFDDSHTPT
jgi:hypothetical protein